MGQGRCRTTCIEVAMAGPSRPTATARAPMTGAAWTVAAVVVGATLGATTPLLVLAGEGAPAAVGTLVALAYLAAAGLWLGHAVADRLPWWGRATAVVLGTGLVTAASGFFLAIGALVATVGAAAHALALWLHPEAHLRDLAVRLALTPAGVTIAVALTDISTDAGFTTTTVAFAAGMAFATASLGLRHRRRS